VGLGLEERYTLPSKSAIFQARAWLGAEPLVALFARVAKPIGTSSRAAGLTAIGAATLSEPQPSEANGNAKDL
jgi:hypothetical protein